MSRPRLVLASGSPRRADLLSALDLVFTVSPPDIDETPLAGESAGEYVARLSAAKSTVGAHGPEAVVIAADTTVVLDGSILGKPEDSAEAHAMLRSLSGRAHEVMTGVSVSLGDRSVTQVVTTLVTFVDLSDADIEWYVGTGEPTDKAGAYAIQGAGGSFVSGVAGSVSNVIGLPVAETVALVRSLGVDLADLRV